MDNLTHSLFALTLANAGFRRVGRGATATLLIASNIPDIEILTTITGGRVAYLAAHRGPTHGPGGLLLGAATAAAVWLVQRLRGRSAEDAGFFSLLGVGCAGVLGHVMMDFATAYGTRVLSPFGDAWYGVDWMPIVDVFLLGVLLAGVIAARMKPAFRARLAALALLLAAGDYAVRATLHSAAVTRAVQLEASLPGAPSRASRPSALFHYQGRGHPAQLPAALPTLGSPFRWRLVVAANGGYMVTEVNLRDEPGWKEAARASAVWFPNDAGPFVNRAAEARLGRVFLNFSRFPSAEILTHTNGDLTVHWYDLRFAEHRVPEGNDRRRHTSPFGAWVRLSAAGTVIDQGLGPG